MIGRRHRHRTPGSQLRELVELLTEAFPWWWWLVVLVVIELALATSYLRRIAVALEAVAR